MKNLRNWSEKRNSLAYTPSFVYITESKCEFFINTRYLIMSDENLILYVDLTKEVNDESMKVLDFSIDKDDKETWIKGVKYGIDENRIAIIVHISKEVDTIYLWEIDENVEFGSYDVGKIYEIIWDNYGNLQIVTPDYVVFAQQKVRIKAFDINLKDLNKNFNDFFEENELMGVRFDGKNHNWLIIGEYLQLPFSYMTFVIKDKIETQDLR